MWRYDVTFPVNHTGVKLDPLAVHIPEAEVKKADPERLVAKQAASHVGEKARLGDWVFGMPFEDGRIHIDLRLGMFPREIAQALIEGPYIEGDSTS